MAVIMKQLMETKATKRSRYKLSLSCLHALCETNYARLLRVFPAYEQANQRIVALDHGRVSFTVTERCRYTTTFIIKQLMGTAPTWAKSLELEVRAYHDARMLEVRSFQGSRHVLGRYDYPNSGMLQKDEKTQQNQFLAEWLEHLLTKGYDASQVGLRNNNDQADDHSLE